ncbi:MAG: aspartate aminotransferase family protein, partial [Phycisphaerales bacterium]
MQHKPSDQTASGTRFDLGNLIRDELSGKGDALRLHDRHINPSAAAVLKTIGFDANYVRGEGAYLFDDEGRRYIDCLGGYAVFAAGRNHPVIRDALKQAMDLDLPSLPGVGVFRTSGLLARRLIELMPGAGSGMKDPLDTVFFANSGAEAIDAAIKHARIATGRAGLVYCQRAYHGLTMGALSVNGNHEFREGFGPLLGSTVEIPFNDLDALEKALRDGGVAAFIVEPIQGKGVNIPDADYLGRAASLCRKHGTLMVLDEIQTGLGRTGKMFACEHFNAGGGEGQWTPDIMVVAKALSGGYVPISALVTRRWIHSKVFPSMNHCSRIQTTFGQNDLSMVAGLATLHVLETERLVERARDVGEYMVLQLREKLGGFQMVKDIRGKGLMIGIEFGPPRSASLRVGWDLLHKLDPSGHCLKGDDCCRSASPAVLAT